MPHGDHRPVLLQEAVAALVVNPDGVYVDATFGRGGHSTRILDALGARGQLIALDRDPSAGDAARRWTDPRFQFHRAWFSQVHDVLARASVVRVDGVLLDLGIASPQIDDAERGFSFRADGPLDMRMDTTRGISAAQWLAVASEAELKKVIADYGEERFAQQIARAIVAHRTQEPITRTRQLAAVVAKAVRTRPRGDRSQDPATRTFQALRIHINEELQELALALEAVVTHLKTGGRVVVISFHSLEDRMVKAFFRRHSLPFGGDSRLARMAIADAALPQPPLKLVGRAVRAGEAEIAVNPRARSAIMRVAERTQAIAA